MVVASARPAVEEYLLLLAMAVCHLELPVGWAVLDPVFFGHWEARLPLLELFAADPTVLDLVELSHPLEEAVHCLLVPRQEAAGADSGLEVAGQ